MFWKKNKFKVFFGNQKLKTVWKNKRKEIEKALVNELKILFQNIYIYILGVRNFKMKNAVKSFESMFSKRRMLCSSITHYSIFRK